MNQPIRREQILLLSFFIFLLHLKVFSFSVSLWPRGKVAMVRKLILPAPPRPCNGYSDGQERHFICGVAGEQRKRISEALKTSARFWWRTVSKVFLVPMLHLSITFSTYTSFYLSNRLSGNIFARPVNLIV